MFKYFYIIKFLITHDLTFLKKCFQKEILNGKLFSYFRLIKRLIKNRFYVRFRYLFWWRLSNEMFIHGGRRFKKTALIINQDLIRKYNIEIGLGAEIDENLNLGHLSGIVITANIKIGKNFTIKQNSTIGVKTLMETHGGWKNNYKIIIGDNVVVGANSCVIGDNITIGSNAIIGAMSFINKDIPSNCTVYTEKSNKIIIAQ